MKTLKINEDSGDLSFGVLWISLDDRLNTKWFRTYELALGQYRHLKKLHREPSIVANINVENLNEKTRK